MNQVQIPEKFSAISIKLRVLYPRKRKSVFTGVSGRSIEEAIEKAREFIKEKRLRVLEAGYTFAEGMDWDYGNGEIGLMCFVPLLARYEKIDLSTLIN